MPIANNAGISIYYEMVGNPSKPVLFLNHGLGNSVANWYSLGYVDLLTPHVCLLMYDGRGFGKSDKCYELADYSSANLISDMTAVLEAAAINQCHFFGNSRGAILGLLASKFIPKRFSSFILGGMNPQNTIRKSALDAFISIIENSIPHDHEYFIKALETAFQTSFPNKKMASEYAQNDLKAMLVATKALEFNVDCSKEFSNLSTIPRLMYCGASDEYHDVMKTYAKEAGIEFQTIAGLDHAHAYWNAKTVVPMILSISTLISPPNRSLNGPL